MATNAGKILATPKGNYNPLTEYYILDIVRDGGKTWVCKQTCTGQTPAISAYWDIWCEDGADGEDGTNTYTYIRYSASADGAGFVDTPTNLTSYIGFYAGTSATAPEDKTAYTWSKYVGESGSGTGDMLKSEFATNGATGVVDTSNRLRKYVTANSGTTYANQWTKVAKATLRSAYLGTTAIFSVINRDTARGCGIFALTVRAGNPKEITATATLHCISADKNFKPYVGQLKLIYTAPLYEVWFQPSETYQYLGIAVLQEYGSLNMTWLENQPYQATQPTGTVVTATLMEDYLITDLTAETAIADTDYFMYNDTSAVANRKTLWSNIKSVLKEYFDTLYNKTASTTVKGGIKIGNGLVMDGETLNATGSGGGTVINDPTTTPATPLETTNVLDDITSISNNTSSNQLAGALALKELNSNLQLIIDYIFALGGMPLIPTMTGYTTPSGEVTYSSEYTSTERFAWCAFDGDEATYWSSKAGVSGASLVYEFANPVTISRFVFIPTASADTGIAHTARIYVGDDGTEWTQVVSEALTATQAKQEQIVNITPVSAKFIKYQPSGYTGKTTNFSYTECVELQAYGFIAIL